MKLSKKVVGIGTVTIRRNVWDNWYGYIGGRRVESFTNSSTEKAEDAARRWFAEKGTK